MGIFDGAFQVIGLKREIYQNANAVRKAIKDAFTRADLHPFTPPPCISQNFGKVG